MERPRSAGGPSWWTWWRVTAAVGLATMIGAFAFVYRFNTLGGSLGGFDNDHFAHLLRSDMLLHGQQPLRDFADAELRGAWPALAYAPSAWAQQAWGRGLLAEAYLTVGGLAVSAALVFLLALDLSKRWFISLLAVACVIVSTPKLYNYEKVLVLAVAAILVRLWSGRPSWTRLAALSAWTAIATLVRHDFGVYVAVGAAAAFIVRGPASAAARLGRAAAYAGLTTLFLAPSIVWVQAHQGLMTYYLRIVASARSESLRSELHFWPPISLAAGLDGDNLVAMTYYLFWAIPVVAAVAIALRLLRRRHVEPEVATGIALLALASAVDTFFLRGNLSVSARFGDAIVPVVLLGAWVVATARGDRGALPTLAWLVPSALMVTMLLAMFVGAEVAVELRSGGLSHGRWATVWDRFRTARAELARLPPSAWDGVSPEGTLAAARYLAECTDPEDRILVVTYAPEVLVFARRLFAAGQATFGLNFYTTETQQREAVARLRQQSVPVVLGSYNDFKGEFVDDYPYVYRYVADHYHDAGMIQAGDRPPFRVLVERGRQPRRTDPLLGLPCFR